MHQWIAYCSTIGYFKALTTTMYNVHWTQSFTVGYAIKFQRSTGNANKKTNYFKLKIQFSTMKSKIKSTWIINLKMCWMQLEFPCDIVFLNVTLSLAALLLQIGSKKKMTTKWNIEKMAFKHLIELVTLQFSVFLSKILSCAGQSRSQLFLR